MDMNALRMCMQFVHLSVSIRTSLQYLMQATRNTQMFCIDEDGKRDAGTSHLPHKQGRDRARSGSANVFQTFKSIQVNIRYHYGDVEFRF